MAPWLRPTLRRGRLLLVIAAAVPVFGTAPAYGAEAAPAPHGSPAPPARTAVPASPAALASASPAASLSPSRAAEPSRAGSRAGEGRMRPGRPDGPAAEEEGDDDSGTVTGASHPGDPEAGYPEEPETAGSAAASATPEEAGLDPARSPEPSTTPGTARQGQEAAEPALRILPLGTGLVLIGLGLGLAFVGLRVRRS
ncbi:hypothetical protein ACWDFL_22890 [Streptomyces bungoensis]